MIELTPGRGWKLTEMPFCCVPDAEAQTPAFIWPYKGHEAVNWGF